MLRRSVLSTFCLDLHCRRLCSSTTTAMTASPRYLSVTVVVYVRMYVFMCVCLYRNTCAANINARERGFACACTYGSAWMAWVYDRESQCVCVYTHVCVHVWQRLWPTWMIIQMIVWVRMYGCMYVCMSAQESGRVWSAYFGGPLHEVHTHTHTHIYIHVNISSSNWITNARDLLSVFGYEISQYGQ
jgi:hypothetical protein